MASSSSDRAALAGVLQARGHRPGGHIASLMENNRPFLEVLWAAQRSGLHYTPINRHLRPARCSTCLTTAEPSALVTSAAMRDVVGGARSLAIDRDLRRWRPAGVRALRRRLVVARRPTCWSTNRKAARCSTRRARPGGPRACRRSCPDTPFGDPASAPVQIAQGIGMTGGGPGVRVPVARAALPRRPARLLHVDASARRDGGRDGALRREDVSRADRTPPRHPRPVRPDDVRAHAPAARGGARALRRVEPAGGHARRRALPGRR